MFEALCPVCEMPMEKKELFQVELEVCRFCGGSWFDPGEIARFLAQGKMPRGVLNTYSLDDSKKIIPQGSRKCPRCRNVMRIINHKGINVDFCDGCRGLWFDRGELLNILQAYVQDAKKRKLSSPVQIEVDEEGDEIIRITDFSMAFASPRKKEPSDIEGQKNHHEEDFPPDPLSEELLAGGGKESIRKALPPDIDKPPINSFDFPPTLSGSPPVGTTLGTAPGYLGETPMDRVWTGGSHMMGEHSGENLVGGLIFVFIKSFIDAWKIR